MPVVNTSFVETAASTTSGIACRWTCASRVGLPPSAVAIAMAMRSATRRNTLRGLLEEIVVVRVVRARADVVARCIECDLGLVEAHQVQERPAGDRVEL